MAFNAKTRGFLIAFLLISWSVALSYPSLRNHFIKSQANETKLYHGSRILMGTFWEVTSPQKKAIEVVFAEAARLEQLLSKYIPDSEISKLNHSGKLKVSPETFYVIKKSEELWKKTEGAFDITVAPLVSLWGFSNRDFRIPDDVQIRKALVLVGSDKIILHEKDNVVEFKTSGMQIDLGAVAKGFALDCAVKKLKEDKIDNCLINAGGQVYALGDKFRKPWKVAIRSSDRAEITEAFELKNKSASTSGNYEQFFFKKGRRYGHIIDPHSGYPVDNQINSVTVIADKGLTADALSTAIFVLGKDKAVEILKNFPGTTVKIYQ
jgi:thiamine biosynthesis lipoprotein